MSAPDYDQARSIQSMLGKLTEHERRAFNELLHLARAGLVTVIERGAGVRGDGENDAASDLMRVSEDPTELRGAETQTRPQAATPSPPLLTPTEVEFIERDFVFDGDSVLARALATIRALREEIVERGTMSDMAYVELVAAARELVTAPTMHRSAQPQFVEVSAALYGALVDAVAALAQAAPEGE